MRSPSPDEIPGDWAVQYPAPVPVCRQWETAPAKIWNMTGRKQTRSLSVTGLLSQRRWMMGILNKLTFSNIYRNNLSGKISILIIIAWKNILIDLSIKCRPFFQLPAHHWWGNLKSLFSNDFSNKSGEKISGEIVESKFLLDSLQSAAGGSIFDSWRRGGDKPGQVSRCFNWSLACHLSAGQLQTRCGW